MLEVGKPITKAQKELFNRLLTIDDLIDISAEILPSYSTVRNLYYRKQSITEENICAVYRMINKAFEKTEDAIVYFSKAKSELNQMLPK